MSFVFGKAALKKLQEEKRSKGSGGSGGSGGDTPQASSSSPSSNYPADAGLAVRFCNATEVERLRATSFRWDGSQGAAYSLDDTQLLTHLAAAVHMARASGATRALKLRGHFGLASERYNTDIGSTPPKLHGIPDDATVLMFYRIDDRTPDGSWQLDDVAMARLILDTPEESD